MRCADLHARVCVYVCACVFIPGSSREVVAPTDVSEHMIRKLRGKNEFTVLVTLKQDHLNSGVVLSIHHSEHRLEPHALKSQLAKLFLPRQPDRKPTYFVPDEHSDVQHYSKQSKAPGTPIYYPQSIRDPNTEFAITA